MCVTEMKYFWKNRKTTESPTRCDDLHSKIEQLSKNRLDIWTCDCDEIQHLDTCSLARAHIPKELYIYVVLILDNISLQEAIRHS